MFTGKGVHEVWKKWWWLDSRGTVGEEVVAGKEQNTVYAHIDIKYSILFKDLAIPRRLIGKKVMGLGNYSHLLGAIIFSLGILEVSNCSTGESERKMN